MSSVFAIFHFYQILNTFNKLNFISDVVHNNWIKVKTIYIFNPKGSKLYAVYGECQNRRLISKALSTDYLCRPLKMKQLRYNSHVVEGFQKNYQMLFQIQVNQFKPATVYSSACINPGK